jgi:hypothetical protein
MLALTNSKQRKWSQLKMERPWPRSNGVLPADAPFLALSLALSMPFSDFRPQT